MANDTMMDYFNRQDESRAQVDLYEAQTKEYESSARSRDALTPGKVKKQELDNKTLEETYRTLIANKPYDDLVRKNGITSQTALYNFVHGPDGIGVEGLVAAMGLAHQKSEAGDRLDLVIAKNDLLYNAYNPVYLQAEEHFKNQGTEGYDAVEGMNALNIAWDDMMQRMISGDVAEQVVGEDGNPTGEWQIPGLPKGASQGDPLTVKNFSQLTFVRDTARELSKQGSAMFIEQEKQKGLLERQKVVSGVADKPTSLKDELSNINSATQILNRNMVSGNPEAFEKSEDGKVFVDKPGFETSNEILRNHALSVLQPLLQANPELSQQLMTAQGDRINKLLETYSGNYDKSNWDTTFAQDYSTYVPRAGVMNVQDAEGNEVDFRQEYLRALNEKIAAEGETLGPQATADRHLRDSIQWMFTNMVTSTPAPPP